MGLSHNFVVTFGSPFQPSFFSSLLLNKMIMIDLLQDFFMCNGEHVGDVYMPKGDDTSLLVSVPGRDMGTGLAGGPTAL